MPTYTRLQIEQAFDKVWETWINKDGESSARKAVDVFLRSDNTKETLLKACEIYTLEHLGDDPEFTYKLSNFLNQNHWEDVLEGASLEKLKARYDEAVRLIEAWNSECRAHWCKVADIKSRVPIAQRALANNVFKEHWRNALNKASAIFRHPLSGEDFRSKIILSFRWFTSISPDKHTVLRLIEGEFGDGVKILDTRKPTPVKEITQEERERMLADFREVFPDVKPYVPKKEKPREITDEHKQQARDLLKSIGASDEEIKEAERANERDGKATGSMGNNDDPFAFFPHAGT